MHISVAEVGCSRQETIAQDSSMVSGPVTGDERGYRLFKLPNVVTNSRIIRY